VPRRVNWELRGAVLNLYLSGYRRPREIASKLAELGYSCKPSYVKKLLWDLRRRGLLGGKAPPAWEELETWMKGVRVHLVAAKELLLANDARGALAELNRALDCFLNMEKAYAIIRVAYARR
jgi:hypothetical protein